MPLVCSSCRDEVIRSDCHRNRYAELICKRCQSKGIKSTWQGRIAHQLQQTMPRIWIGCALSAGLAMLAWAIYMLFLATEITQPFQ